MRRMIVAVTWLLPSTGLSQPPAPRVIPDAVSCARCTISVRRLVRLGSTDGDGSLAGVPSAVQTDARGRYWVLVWSQLPLIFDSTGRFVTSVGRSGQGPGEFRSPTLVAPILGDSVLLIDNGLRRATIVSAELRATRSVQLRTQLFTMGVVGWPNDVIVNAFVAGQRAAGWPLHRLSFAGAEATVAASFGADSIVVRQREVVSPTHRVEPSATGRVWAAGMRRYSLTEWTPGGQLVSSFERAPSWFNGTSPVSIGTPTSPPPPSISAMREDAGGLLWVFVRVAAPTWREAWPLGAAGRVEIAVADLAQEKLFHTMVEVIDPKAGRVVARRRLDEWVIAAMPGPRIASYVVDADGTPRAAISELAVVAR